MVELDLVLGSEGSQEEVFSLLVVDPGQDLGPVGYLVLVLEREVDRVALDQVVQEVRTTFSAPQKLYGTKRNTSNSEHIMHMYKQKLLTNNN